MPLFRSVALLNGSRISSNSLQQLGNDGTKSVSLFGFFSELLDLRLLLDRGRFDVSYMQCHLMCVRFTMFICQLYFVHDDFFDDLHVLRERLVMGIS